MTAPEDQAYAGRKFLTLDEVAELLGLPLVEVYGHVRRGDWPGCVYSGDERGWRVPLDVVDG